MLFYCQLKTAQKPQSKNQKRTLVNMMMINMASASSFQYYNNNIVIPNKRSISISCSKHLHFNNNNNKSLKISALHKPHAAVVTKDSWESSILKSELPVLVEFYANWCGPCKMVHRIIDEVAAEYTGKLKCFVVNADNDPQIAEDYEIKAVPVVVFIKNGAKCESIAGTMPKEFYVAAIERILK